MDTFNFKMKGSESAPPIDRQTNHQLLRSKSLYSLGGPTINSPTSDPLDMDAWSLLRYPRTAAIGGRLSPSVDVFKSPSGIDCGRFHQMLLHNHPNLSSSRSRGSSSSSPLSAIENLETPSPRPSPLFPSPLNVDEDVLVMDGILVGSSPGGRGRAVLDSGSTSANGLFKTEICRTWEDSGVCRYGSMCQFAHGKEELRPSRHTIKSKAEVCKTYAASGMCGYGAKCRFFHQQMTALSSEAIAAISPVNMRGESKQKQGGTSTINQDQVLQVQDDWSPEDDGIEILHDLPSYSTHQLASAPLSRQDVNTYISNVLYGQSRRPRLSVFTEFCP